MTLTRDELRRLNQQLAAQGMKICSCCGRQLALENFSGTGRGGTYRRAQCRLCFRVVSREKYTPPPAVKRAYNQRYYARKRQEILAHMRVKYQERKRQRASALLDKHNLNQQQEYHNTRRMSEKIDAVQRMAGMTGELRKGSQETGRE